MAIDADNARLSGSASTLVHRIFRPTGTILFVLLVLLRTASATDAPNPNANLIVFSPGAISLNNPVTPTAPAPPAIITVNITAYDAQGNVLLPSAGNPLHLQVYGAPADVISPTEVTLTSSSNGTSTNVQFTYSGAFFPNNMELAAWMADPSAGESLGTTLFVQQNRPACSFGSSSFDVDMLSSVPKAISVKAIVGPDTPDPSKSQTFTIDTGSLGVIVPKPDLIMGSQVHGPGAQGQKFYNSSGFIFSGNYYLAPVSVELSDHTFVQTNPILVLVVDKVSCDPSFTHCHSSGGTPTLHYLGVGFDRNKTGPGDLFDSPADNAFLQLTDALSGTDINQGYILSKQGVTLGITAADASGFNGILLQPNSSVPGDWNPIPGCYTFTKLPGHPQFCGNLLLDVGIDQMYLDLLSDQRPDKSYDSHDRVPDGTEMNILAGTTSDAPMSYEFKAVQPPKQPVGPAPKFAQWHNSSTIFVNTGRRPLLEFNYLYSGQCGQVGFQHVAK
ncbi:MAG: hypothetical protein WA655_23970 [Candidatus Korobacteraceae bacterium]